MITIRTKIQDTELPKVIKNVLSNCHIFTISDLLKYDVQRLLRIRTLGKNRVSRINNYLNDNGFFLD